MAESVLGLDPLNSDTDGDGMQDGAEQNDGLDPVNPDDANDDQDMDGRTNLEEALAGTDPNDPYSVFRVVVVDHTATQVTVSFPSRITAIYEVQFKNDLTDPTWTGETTIVADYTTSKATLPIPAGMEKIFYSVLLKN